MDIQLHRLRSMPWKVSDALITFFATWIAVPTITLELLILASRYIPSVHAFLRALVDQNSIAANFVFTLIEVITGFSILALYLKHYKKSLSDLGWRNFKVLESAAWIILSMIGFFFLITAVYAIVGLLFHGFDPNQPQVNAFTNPTTPSALIISYLALVAVPPILEETVFRGFVFPAFSKRFGLIWGAVITSVLFGLAHALSGWDPNVMVYTFVLSLLLCTMYWRLGSIWPGVLLHMINNYIAFVGIMHK
jgi:membrane protease YdiL (CAAX protease family)